MLSLPGCPPTRRQCRRVGGYGSEPPQRQFQGTVSAVFHVNNHPCSGSLSIVISEHITWDWTVNTNTTRVFLRKKSIKGDMSVQAHHLASSRFLKRLWNSVFILRSMACHALCLEMLRARQAGCQVTPVFSPTIMLHNYRTEEEEQSLSIFTFIIPVP